jgi:type I restriction enzyme S subunit
MRREVLSGYRWYAELPPNWEERKIQYSAIVYSGGTPDRNNLSYWDEGNVPWLTSGEINKGTILTADHRITELAVRESSARWATKGTVLIALNGQGKTKGTVALLEMNATINQSLCCIKPNKDHYYRFVYYYLAGRYAQIRGLVGEDRDGLNQALVKSIVLPLPTVQLQKQISFFLDEETTRIHALISKKERQIELLQEKRQAIITKAITRGIDPSANMKDSGVAWIGKIPEEWQVKRLKHIFRNMDYIRIPLSGEDRADLEKIYPYYGASGIIDHVDRYLFDEDLILIAEDGANLLSRSTPLAFIARGKYWVNNHAHILKPYSDNLDFWESTLQSYDYEPLISGSAQPKLTAEALGEIWLPFPPISEQKRLSDFVKEENSMTNLTSEKIVASILLLREYRSSLITAAVSGQIDVSRMKTKAPE